MSNIYDINVKTIDGESVKLERFSGKTLLIVNVASACGLTPQYEALEALYEAHKDQGLEVLGFPCNQFGEQEPGTEADIKEFCSMKFDIKFPMFSKVEVNGENQHPLYKQLLSAIPERTAAPESGFEEKMKSYGKEVKDGAVMWNFEKFLVNTKGEIIGHFSPDMTPDHPILASAINTAITADR
ncbi:glutathione peroxidase [Pseudomaricurvus sp.]|uniref:glutathione peroxidase n=1 Tax=Pseudomaricurvus sp. TaxID=2004510 RepID=UPI003F6AD7F8